MPKSVDRSRAFVVPVVAWVVLLFVAVVMSHSGRRQTDEVHPSMVMSQAEAPILQDIDDALAAFELVDGFEIEAIATEPLVVDPVAMAFDEDGRIWVAQMQTYMPDVNATGELAPNNKIVVLEDKNGDGELESTTFMDGLVLPRAIAPAYGGLLMIEPPNLYFCKDLDGDGQADEKRLLHSGFGGRDNPEHAANGLLYGIDNWIYLSQHNIRIRFDGEKVITERTPAHGQWGITKDDAGRLYYTPNSDTLRGDVYPKHYAGRNRNQRNISGMNLRVGQDLSVFAIRLNLGVNRGYRDGVLRPDGRLMNVTSACGPSIYRSTAFPSEFYGDAFICETAGNLIKRLSMSEKDGIVQGHNAYDGYEFLASRDERFRPVNTCVGPDGALYIVDMYRGVIQHKTYVTPYLTEHIKRRNLETPLGLGRIYRVFATGAPERAAPRLSTASDDELVGHLSHPDGWWRDTAQRLLVERRAVGVEEQLRTLARESENHLTRLHALWTLEGVGALTLDDGKKAMRDRHAVVKIAGLRLAENWIADPTVMRTIRALATDADRNVRIQVALTLGQSSDGAAVEALATLVHEGDAYLRSAVISGLADREIEMIEHLVEVPGWPSSNGARNTLSQLVDCVLRSPKREARSRLLEIIAAQAEVSPSRAELMLGRLANAQALESENPKMIKVSYEPNGWDGLVTSETSQLAARATQSNYYLEWPGKPFEAPPSNVRPLTEIEQARFNRGRVMFVICLACHGMNGEGVTGQYPSLVDSERVLGDEDKLAKILLHGLTGPIKSGGEEYDSLMPPPTLGSDEDIAAVMTFVRRSWGHEADPVTAATVAAVRAKYKDRTEPWRAHELDADQ